MDKTSGEARNLIKGKRKEQGLEALRDVHAWFAETSKAGMVEWRIALMCPSQAKNDEEVLELVTRWHETYERLKEIVWEVMLYPHKATAIKRILPGSFKEHLDMTKGTAFGERDDEAFADLVNYIMQWATARKLEAISKKGTIK